MSTWGIAFGDTVLEGDFTIGSHDVNFASGTGIIRFPDDGTVIIPTSLKVINHSYVIKRSNIQGIGLKRSIVPLSMLSKERLYVFGFLFLHIV